jgi:hypothetical protein
MTLRTLPRRTFFKLMSPVLDNGTEGGTVPYPQCELYKTYMDASLESSVVSGFLGLNRCFQGE